MLTDNTHSKALSIGEFLKQPNAYVISVDAQNIGHTATLENVSTDNIHFIGIDEIVTFTHRTEFTEHLYVFNTKALIYIHSDNYSNTPYCQHLYTLTDIGGQRVELELGYVAQLYSIKGLNQ